MKHVAVVVWVGLILSGAGMALWPQATFADASPEIEATTRDCSAAYTGTQASCLHVRCTAKYAKFLGTWKGEFHAYVRKQSSPGHAVFRLYYESVVYAADDCLRNLANGDTFIVGHEIDRYPAFGTLPSKVEKNLLITGRHADGTPYLRTVGGEGTYDYKLAFQDTAAGLSIWRLHLPAANGQPPMAFTTIDGRDVAARPTHRREVTVTMQVGPDKTPYWQGVIAYGSHTRD